jgi:hypothetical protein
MNTVFVSAPYGLGIKNNSLYVCEGLGGIKVFNITKAYDPIQVSDIRINNTTFYDVIPYANILIAQVNDGFILYDIRYQPDATGFSFKNFELSL